MVIVLHTQCLLHILQWQGDITVLLPCLVSTQDMVLPLEQTMLLQLVTQIIIHLERVAIHNKEDKSLFKEAEMKINHNIHLITAELTLLLTQTLLTNHALLMAMEEQPQWLEATDMVINLCQLMLLSKLEGPNLKEEQKKAVIMELIVEVVLVLSAQNVATDLTKSFVSRSS